ncbi:MAG TPA: 1-acyl-sn-glycerol-3-phosphate acyltransferase [bacterium]|nr:1-acyl-sn-glycerol-3-phosphate acyltransferase [bacterium]
MVSILKVLYHILSKKRFALFIVFSILVIAAGSAASKIKLEEDITKAIPFGDDGAEYNRILNEFKFLDRIIFTVSFADRSKEDHIELANFANDFIEGMKKSECASMIDSFSNEKTLIDQKAVYSHFYEYMPLFLDEKDYAEIEKAASPEVLKETVGALYRNIISPAGTVSAQFIRRDPLSMTFKGMEKLKSLNPESSFEIIDGHIFADNRKSLIFFIQPALSAGDTGNNAKLVSEMERVLSETTAKYEGRIRGGFFGGIPIAVGSADRIKTDVIISSVVAVILIFMILVLYFRKLKFVPLVFLPAIFGALTAVSVAVIIKGTISAIALGITSVLLGITVDYAIHTVSHILKRKNTGEAISELSFPMILSCFTTVAAFACLLFLDSSALNDLGLLALVSVLSAMLFSVIVLPHIVDLMKGVRKENDFEKENSIISRISAFEFEKRKFLVIVVFIAGAVFYFFSKNTAFEDDLNNINYMKPETLEAMKNIDRISSINQKSVYLVFSGKTFDEVLEKRGKSEKLISGLLEKGLAESVTDISKLVLSKREQLEKIEKWNSFFTPERKEKLKKSLITEGLKLGFKEETFLPFFELTNTVFKPVEPVELTKFAPSLFDEWIAESKNGYMTAALLKLSGPDSSEISEYVSGSSDMFLFDRAEIMHRFVKYLKMDFEKLLTYSILVVFLILFILSGRIELALLSMIPVTFSWIWTLGVMNIFGIKFNIVNIIIVTFIFGLGIDYVAFIMRAKMQEYAHGSKETMISYKSSILISCLTTVAGVGALFGAVHPALRSIALIAVTGMISTLINSFVVAPFLFDWLMIRQKKKKAPPHTFIVFTYTFLAYANYVIFSLILSSLGFAIFTTWPFKSGRNIRKYLYHLMIKSLARLVILSAPQVRLRKNNPFNEDFKKPAVIISNHSSFLDILMMLSLQVKIVMVTKKWVSSNPIFGKLVQFADFFTTTEGFEKMAPKLQKCIDAGYSVVVFPEGTRGDGINLQRFHKGAFFLADQLKLDIVPIVIHGAGHSIKKGEFSVRGSTLSYNILKRIPADSTEYGETYQEKCRNISAMFKREYESVYEKLGTVNFYRDRLMKNYIYKGPDIEWYARIKIMLEDNYRFFNDIIPRKAEIYDIGCGMGMLTFMLTLTSKERSVKAVDYDETKINLAKNCYSCSERTTFICDDVTKIAFEKADVFIMNDVLHYLPVEEQSALIEKCSGKLNENGIIIIRDADSGMSGKHGNTVVTEKFSTGLKFNQADTGLNFVSRSVIEKAAVSAGLSFEVVKHQKKTSNVVYLLKKQGVADV